MNKKPKYIIVKRFCRQFGKHCIAYVIAKKTWFGFYWDTDDYFHKENTAQNYCNKLNNKN